MNIDFAPTLLDLAGIKIPKDMQERVLKSNYSENALPNGEMQFIIIIMNIHFGIMSSPHYGVSTGKYKLIHYYYDMDEWELFDIENDKNEMRNLYGNSQYLKIIKELKSKLKELQIQYGDDMTLGEMRSMTDVNIQRVYSNRNN